MALSKSEIEKALLASEDEGEEEYDEAREALEPFFAALKMPEEDREEAYEALCAWLDEYSSASKSGVGLMIGVSGEKEPQE